MTKLHRPVWEGMLTALSDILRDGRPADKVLQFYFKQNRKLGSGDRRVFAEGVYDVVRWWRRLAYAVDCEWSTSSLREVLSAWCAVNDISVGRGVDAGVGDVAEVKRRWADLTIARAVRESVPDWMDEWGLSELGEQKWDEVLRALNSLAPVYLRVNRLKARPAEVLARLRDENIEAILVEGDAIRLNKRANVFLTKAFHAGLFEVQDLNSQKIALELGVEPGMRVIDACAGAGGKSLHLASLMGGKGRVLSLDVVEKKLEQLRLRARRAGASVIESRLIEGRKTIKRLESSADRLLLDVPCSGMGVLRRNPDAKWRLSLDEVARVGAIQDEILNAYPSMLKPGGVMVYATCSIIPSENSDRVRRFLSQNETRIELLKEETLWPEVNGPDGFYFARLKMS